MTRPSVSAAFSTNTNASAGPQTGLSTRLDPGSGLRAEGVYAETRLGARAFNFLLGIVGDWIGYLDSLASVFDLGGTLTPNGNVTITTPTTDTVVINGVVHYSPADGGGAAVLGTTGLNVSSHINSSGYVRGTKRTVIGAAAAGITTYRMDTYEHVYLEAVGVAFGTIWQIDLTGANSQECMRFYYNNAAFGVIIRDPSGTPLVTLSTGSGQPIAVTIQNNAGTCVVIDRTLHP